MSQFLIIQRFTSSYCFELQTSKGEVLLVSKSYQSRENCEDAVLFVAKKCLKDSIFCRSDAEPGRFYFTIEASIGRLIATSPIYLTKFGREKAILQVRKNARLARIEFLHMADAKKKGK